MATHALAAVMFLASPLLLSRRPSSDNNLPRGWLSERVVQDNIASLGENGESVAF